MNISAIEIGTNSIKMIIVQKNGINDYSTLVKKSVVNRLSSKMYNNEKFISEESMRKTIDIIGEFSKEIEQHQAVLIGIFATSVLRDAKNKQEFLEQVKIRYNYSIQIISGEKEAELAYMACLSHIKNISDEFIVIDIGGGSTEVIMGNNSYMDNCISIDVGAVRLTELFVNNYEIQQENINDMRSYVNEKLKEINFFIPKKIKLIATGGTIKTIGTMALEVDFSKEEEVNGKKIFIDKIQDIFNNLISIKKDERKKILGLNPKRADVIIAGIQILLCIMNHYEINEMIISANGVLNGIIQDYLSKLT